MARRTPIRRSQLLTPFGPGSMFVLQGGCSVIISSLDYWFSCANGSVQGNDDGTPIAIFEGANLPDRWRIHDARLLSTLQVESLRQAPENGKHPMVRADHSEVRVRPLIPVWRFPRWHICPNCQKMEQIPLQRQRE